MQNVDSIWFFLGDFEKKNATVVFLISDDVKPLEPFATKICGLPLPSLMTVLVLLILKIPHQIHFHAKTSLL
jgi:hypothetical protein